MQVLCQRSFHGIDGVFCLPETTELSGILTFRKKAPIAPWVNARPTRCQSEEIANAVRFFASDEASFVGGVELFVDGG